MTLHANIIEAFVEYYKNSKGIKYVFQAGKDGVAVKSIIRKLKEICLEERQSEEDILKAFKYMLENISDAWILDHLELSLINSKFNPIISQIKNGRSANANARNNKGFDIGKNTWIAGALEDAIQLTRVHSD
jgi:hypothetical protein